MPGNGVRTLRLSHRAAKQALPIEKNPQHTGRYTCAPTVPPGQYTPSAPKKPGTFLKYEDRGKVLPKASDHNLDGEGPKRTFRRHETSRNEK